jgi:acyl-CoA synthetase (AMP-forming)/AMP-acid ligase II
MGLIAAWLSGMYYATPLVVMSPLAFLARPQSWLLAIDRFRATMSAGPNFAFELCLNKIDDASLQPSPLVSIAALFGTGGAGIGNLLKAGTTRLVPALFEDKSGALVNALSAASGIRGRSAINLVAMVVSLVLALLKKFTADNGLDAYSLATLLVDQAPHLYGTLDARLTEAVGYAGPAAYFGRLGGEAAVMAKRVSTRDADALANTAAAATTAKAVKL